MSCKISIIKRQYFYYAMQAPNGWRSRSMAGAGVDTAWEQEKLEARKMLAVGAADRASERQANKVVGARTNKVVGARTTIAQP